MANHYYKLDNDGRIGATSSVEYDFMAGEAVFDFPEDFDFGKQGDYKIVDDSLVYDPIPEPEETPTQLDIIEAQVAYTAMMTDTMLGV